MAHETAYRLWDHDSRMAFDFTYPDTVKPVKVDFESGKEKRYTVRGLKKTVTMEERRSALGVSAPGGKCGTPVFYNMLVDERKSIMEMNAARDLVRYLRLSDKHGQKKNYIEMIMENTSRNKVYDISQAYFMYKRKTYPFVSKASPFPGTLQSGGIMNVEISVCQFLPQAECCNPEKF